MKKLPERLYWFKKANEPDLLIYDAGYANGDIYIYEFKTQMKATELAEQIKIHGDPWRKWELTDFYGIIDRK